MPTTSKRTQMGGSHPMPFPNGVARFCRNPRSVFWSPSLRPSNQKTTSCWVRVLGVALWFFQCFYLSVYSESLHTRRTAKKKGAQTAQWFLVFLIIILPIIHLAPPCQSSPSQFLQAHHSISIMHSIRAQLSLLCALCGTSSLRAQCKPKFTSTSKFT